MRTLKCDFCYDDVEEGGDVRFHVQSFTQVVDLPTTLLVIESLKDWCACQKCAHLIHANDWKGLVERVIVKEGYDDEVKELMRPLLLEFWQSMRNHLETIH